MFADQRLRPQRHQRGNEHAELVPILAGQRGGGELLVQQQRGHCSLICAYFWQLVVGDDDQGECELPIIWVVL